MTHNGSVQNDPVVRSSPPDRQIQNADSGYITPPSLDVSTSVPTTRTISVVASPATMSAQQPPTTRNPYASRCSLHIRQQPRAARAGPGGKDRRPVDPPPVLQLMINDFDPENEADVAEMRSQFVVHCKLVSATTPSRDLTIRTTVGEDGSRDLQRLLIGTDVASPFHTEDDPDPDTMPQHPSSTTSAYRPPSPSSRFFSSTHTMQPRNPRDTKIPSAFFIFADLSMRRAGEYRLEFALMKIVPGYLTVGGEIPILCKITSDAFRVVNAKDFDQVHPSTPLIRGLIVRGAGFPLKLKKGTREGQRRRNAGDNAEGSDEEDADEDDEG